MGEIPNFWSHLDGGSSQEEIDAADRAHDEWLKTPAGQRFLEDNRKWAAKMNARTSEE